MPATKRRRTSTAERNHRSATPSGSAGSSQDSVVEVVTSSTPSSVDGDCNSPLAGPPFGRRCTNVRSTNLICLQGSRTRLFPAQCAHSITDHRPIGGYEKVIEVFSNEEDDAYSIELMRPPEAVRLERSNSHPPRGADASTR